MLVDSTATYTPGISERRSGTTKFYHGDNLGSTRGITNTSQSATDGILYDAFGLVVSRTGNTPTPFGFVGREQYQTDADSGLLLLGHRYYDPYTGRFISQDPIADGNNWYVYVENNPLTGIDPAGLLRARGGIGSYSPDKMRKTRLGGDDPNRQMTDPDKIREKLKEKTLTPNQRKALNQRLKDLGEKRSRFSDSRLPSNPTSEPTPRPTRPSASRPSFDLLPANKGGGGIRAIRVIGGRIIRVFSPLGRVINVIEIIEILIKAHDEMLYPDGGA